MFIQECFYNHSFIPKKRRQAPTTRSQQPRRWLWQIWPCCLIWPRPRGEQLDTLLREDFMVPLDREPASAYREGEVFYPFFPATTEETNDILPSLEFMFSQLGANGYGWMPALGSSSWSISFWKLPQSLPRFSFQLHNWPHWLNRTCSLVVPRLTSFKSRKTPRMERTLPSWGARLNLSRQHAGTRSHSLLSAPQHTPPLLPLGISLSPLFSLPLFPPNTDLFTSGCKNQSKAGTIRFSVQRVKMCSLIKSDAAT